MFLIVIKINHFFLIELKLQYQSISSLHFSNWRGMGKPIKKGMPWHSDT